MEEKHKYDVYIDGEIYREDIEADSEEGAIEEAQNLLVAEREYSQDEEEQDEEEINLADYKFKAVLKS